MRLETSWDLFLDSSLHQNGLGGSWAKQFVLIFIHMLKRIRIENVSSAH